MKKKNDYVQPKTFVHKVELEAILAAVSDPKLKPDATIKDPEMEGEYD